ncbi:MAG TPA: hypothetical protein VJJ81_04215 [Candidatus Babeliales bacterium]|nr:hypothetical protein [Candidatus Babeliales bacterium]
MKSRQISCPQLILIIVLSTITSANIKTVTTNSTTNTEITQIQAAKNTEVNQEIWGCRWEDNEFTMSLKSRLEVLYGKNANMFSGSPLDQTLWAQGIWDLKTRAKIGEALESYITIRNKYLWGSPDSVANTSTNTLKLADAKIGEHSHFLSKQIFWLREGWVDINLNQTIDVETDGQQHFKTGLFPYELGRGIALGSAYAYSPGLLGFYADAVVDQNAPGFLLYGDLVKDRVLYDMYLGLLHNDSDNFGRVNEKIYLQQKNPVWLGARGFGLIDFVIASRLIWFPLKKSCGDPATLSFEPYFMYNRDPELKIEFPADSSSNLITLGLAGECETDKFQFGFEFAFNRGHQSVKGWDSNVIDISTNSTTGALIEQYSKVVTSDPKTNPDAAPAVVSSANKTVVNKSINSAELNGQQLGTSGLYNSLDRFTPPYLNKYKGFMFVVDGTYIFQPDLKLSGTIGWATGDENPNKDLNNFNESSIDGDYSGFIGLQEAYSGKRVISLFVIGANTVIRPTSAPLTDSLQTTTFGSDSPGFSNLVYGGIALDFKTNFCTKPIDWNFGLLSYWQDSPTHKFNLKTKLASLELASKHLGTELNGTLTINTTKNLRGFLIGALFFPGQHYRDITGMPLGPNDLEVLETLAGDGVAVGNTPLLNSKTAFVINFGLEYEF